MRSVLRLIMAGAAILDAGCNARHGTGASAQTAATAAQPARGADPWRERMQKNHNAAQSIDQQVRRLTRDLQLTSAQQTKVRQLALVHNARIQAILDTAPAALTRDSFTAQVHAISRQFHDSVNAMLTPHQLELMRAMLGRLDSGTENRRAP
jgi:hypothetical protein